MVVCDTDYQPKRPTKEHSQVEANTLIPLHVLLSIQECILQEEHVWYPDKTNVLILLMDLVSHDYLSAMAMLILLTGKRDASCWSYQKDWNKQTPFCPFMKITKS